MKFKLINTSGSINDKIQLDTPEELLQFMMNQGEDEFVIIKPGEGIRPGFRRSYWTIEIYDDYREE